MRAYTKEEKMTRSKFISIDKCPCVPSYRPHTHEFVELVYILSGSVEHTVDGRSYSLSCGDILFMNCGCTHSFRSDKEYSYINILFTPELIGEEVVNFRNAFSLFSLTAFNEMRGEAEFGKISFSGKERQEIESLISEMLREYDARETYWENILINDLNKLIIKMLRKTELGLVPTELDDTWAELSEYIDKNLGSKLTLSELAQKCFYNPSYFSRIFKERFGESLVEYLMKKRVDYALALLGETDLSVDEISLKVGFSDRNALYRAFSKYNKLSPSQYRSKNVKK